MVKGAYVVLQYNYEIVGIPSIIWEKGIILRGHLLKAEGLCFLEELSKDFYGSRLAGLYTKQLPMKKRNYLFNWIFAVEGL